MRRAISSEAIEALLQVAERGGQCPECFDEEVVFEMIRLGLAERVSIGVEWPTVVLTPYGKVEAFEVGQSA